MATLVRRGNKYRIRVYVGYDVNGKQLERTRTWAVPEGWSDKRAEKEAQRQAAIFEEEVRQGASNPSMRFAAFVDYWMQYHAEKHLKPKTVFEYKKLLPKINLAIGHLPLEKITPMHLMAFYNDLENNKSEHSSYRCRIDLKERLKKLGLSQIALSRQSGLSSTTLTCAVKKESVSRVSAEKICTALNEEMDSLFEPTSPHKVLSASTIQHYHRLISSILGDAVNWQYIPYNPCSRISPPKERKQAKVSYLDDIQAQELLYQLQNVPKIYRRAVTLLLLTGLRRSELTGLQWSDIDFERKTITVSRTVQYLPNRGVYITDTKSSSSHRIVFVSRQVIDIFLEISREQKGTSDYVITNEKGNPMSPERLTHWFRKFIKTTDLPLIDLHGLRHTYATLCIANGVPITTVSAQLGHSSVATTANIYAHAIKTSQANAANIISQLFERKP